MRNIILAISLFLLPINALSFNGNCVTQNLTPPPGFSFVEGNGSVDEGGQLLFNPITRQYISLPTKSYAYQLQRESLAIKSALPDITQYAQNIAFYNNFPAQLRVWLENIATKLFGIKYKDQQEIEQANVSFMLAKMKLKEFFPLLIDTIKPADGEAPYWYKQRIKGTTDYLEKIYNDDVNTLCNGMDITK